MTTRFHTTNNARWFAVREPHGEEGSERVWLFRAIESSPGIGSAEIVARWPFNNDTARSRLKELSDKGCIRFERIADIFE